MSGIQVHVRRLKELRKLHGLSQEELALRAGVSVRTVGNAEAGRRIRPEFLGFLAGALGVEVAVLAADRDEYRLGRFHQQRIDRVLTTIEAFAVEGDSSEYKRLTAPSVVLLSLGPDCVPFSGEYRGVDGIRQLADVCAESMAFEEVQEVTELHSVGNKVTIVGKSGMRALATNKAVVTNFKHSFEFDDDRVVRIKNEFDVPLVVEAFTPG